jgi:hypothetical protein
MDRLDQSIGFEWALEVLVTGDDDFHVPGMPICPVKANAPLTAA